MRALALNEGLVVGEAEKMAKGFDYCTLGFDIKLNPENRPFVIEINGVNSGLAGLESMLGGADIKKTRKEIRNSICRTFTGRNLEEVTFSGMLRSSIIMRRRDYKHMSIQPERLEALADDKAQTKKYINGEFLAPYIEWDGTWAQVENFIRDLKMNKSKQLDLENFPLVVAKGNEGCHGDKVRIMFIDDLKGIMEFLEDYAQRGYIGEYAPSKALLEGFVASKKIAGKYADGCMRYLVDFLTVHGERRSWQKVFHGAYWRISPSDSSDPNVCYKANLNGENPAKPEFVEAADLRIVEKAVEKTIDNIVADGDLFRI